MFGKVFDYADRLSETVSRSLAENNRERALELPDCGLVICLRVIFLMLPSSAEINPLTQIENR